MTTMASPLPPVPQVSGCSRACRVPGCAPSQLRRRRHRSLKAAAGLPAAGISTLRPRRRLGDGRRPRAAAASLPGLALVRSVVLDIEGTTSPISFVTDVLFPYARDNVRKHLDATYGSDETNDDIALLRAQVERDLAEGVAGAVPVPPDEAGKDEVIDALVANVEAMIKADRKITSLKQLQGHIWRTGFEGQEIKGVVFDDVPPALGRWHASGIKTYIYSSGSREAQRLIFGNTTYGDLRKYLCGFFDTTVGTKREPRSYYEIWQTVGVDRPSQILFLTDVYQEATAAKAAGSKDKAAEAGALKKTVQISNLSPILSVDYIKQLFGICGKVVDCTITDSKHFAYVEYSKPEEATTALQLNNRNVGGRPLNVEMAKSLPPKANNNLPMMMQQAVQLQQMQFQQALLMQQTIATQQAAARAATMKSATEAAAARAAEISRKLKAEGLGGDSVEEKDAKGKSRSPSPPTRRSKSRSRSPIKYRRSRRSRSYSPPVRRSREHRSRSPSRSRHSKYASDRSHRDDRDRYSRSGRRESDRSRDHHSSSSRRNRSRSKSPRHKKPSRDDSQSPKQQREESTSPSKSRSARAGSRSSRHHKGSKSLPTRERHSRRTRHSRSRSPERKHRHSDKKDSRRSEVQNDKRRSHRDRGSRGDKDERSVNDEVERSHRSNRGDKDRSVKDEAERSQRGSRGDKDDRSVKDEAERSQRRSRGDKDERPVNDEAERSQKGNRGDKDERSVKDEAERPRRGDKDEYSVQDPVEDRSMDASAAAHKRSSTVSEDEILNNNSSNHKKSKRDDSLEDDERNDVCTAVADINGKHGPGVDGSLGGAGESAI